MTPTEGAIQARTKEAFDFKLSNEQWDSIMVSIKPAEVESTEKSSQNTAAKS